MFLSFWLFGFADVFERNFFIILAGLRKAKPNLLIIIVDAEKANKKA
jgi:hypothetical protein